MAPPMEQKGTTTILNLREREAASAKNGYFVVSEPGEQGGTYKCSVASLLSEGGSKNAVRYDIDQELNSSQKAMARNNIGVGYDYDRVYVNMETGSDQNDGLASNSPKKTWKAALDLAAARNAVVVTLSASYDLVTTGNYDNNVRILVDSSVTGPFIFTKPNNGADEADKELYCYTGDVEITAKCKVIYAIRGDESTTRTRFVKITAAEIDYKYEGTSYITNASPNSSYEYVADGNVGIGIYYVNSASHAASIKIKCGGKVTHTAPVVADKLDIECGEFVASSPVGCIKLRMVTSGNCDCGPQLDAIDAVFRVGGKLTMANMYGYGTSASFTGVNFNTDPSTLDIESDTYLSGYSFSASNCVMRLKANVVDHLGGKAMKPKILYLDAHRLNLSYDIQCAAMIVNVSEVYWNGVASTSYGVFHIVNPAASSGCQVDMTSVLNIGVVRGGEGAMHSVGALISLNYSDGTVPSAIVNIDVLDYTLSTAYSNNRYPWLICTNSRGKLYGHIGHFRSNETVTVFSNEYRTQNQYFWDLMAYNVDGLENNIIIDNLSSPVDIYYDPIGGCDSFDGHDRFHAVKTSSRLKFLLDRQRGYYSTNYSSGQVIIHVCAYTDSPDMVGYSSSVISASKYTMDFSDSTQKDHMGIMPLNVKMVAEVPNMCLVVAYGRFGNLTIKDGFASVALFDCATDNTLTIDVPENIALLSNNAYHDPEKTADDYTSVYKGVNNLKAGYDIRTTRVSIEGINTIETENYLYLGRSSFYTYIKGDTRIRVRNMSSDTLCYSYFEGELVVDGCGAPGGNAYGFPADYNYYRKGNIQGGHIKFMNFDNIYAASSTTGQYGYMKIEYMNCGTVNWNLTNSYSNGMEVYADCRNFNFTNNLGSAHLTVRCANAYINAGFYGNGLSSLLDLDAIQCSFGDRAYFSNCQVRIQADIVYGNFSMNCAGPFYGNAIVYLDAGTLSGTIKMNTIGDFAGNATLPMKLVARIGCVEKSGWLDYSGIEEGALPEIYAVIGTRAAGVPIVQLPENLRSSSYSIIYSDELPSVMSVDDTGLKVSKDVYANGKRAVVSEIVKEIIRVSELPEDAGEHPEIWYVVVPELESIQVDGDPDEVDEV